MPNRKGVIDAVFLGKPIEVRVISEVEKSKIVAIHAHDLGQEWLVSATFEKDVDFVDYMIKGGHAITIISPPESRHFCMLIAEHLVTALEQNRSITHDSISGKGSVHGNKNENQPAK